MAIILSEEEVTLRTEVVSPRIVINWNPDTDTGSLHFAVEHMEYVNGAFHRLIPKGEYSLTLDDLMLREVVVGAQSVPPQLIVGFIKQLFADLHAEHGE